MRYFVLIISFLILSGTSYPQKFVKHDSTIVSVSTGYGTFNVGGADDFYHFIIEGYNEAGIPVSIDHDYGNSFVLRGELLHSFTIPEIWLGISAGYSYTPAYSSCDGFGGTLTINSAISCYDIALAGKFEAMKIFKLPVYLNIKMGMTHYSLEVNESLNLYNYPQMNYNLNSSLTQDIPFTEITFNTSVKLRPVTLTFEAGYKITLNGDQIIQYKYFNQEPMAFALEDNDVKGFVFLVGAEYGL